MNMPQDLTRNNRRARLLASAFIINGFCRQFLRISIGVVGAVAAIEAIGLEADTNAAQANVQKVPIKTGKQKRRKT